MLNSERLHRILGETARETGILIVVFAPLDATFTETPVKPALVATMFLFGILLTACGIILEAAQ
jgi:hypothetical protein